MSQPNAGEKQTAGTKVHETLNDPSSKKFAAATVVKSRPEKIMQMVQPGCRGNKKPSAPRNEGTWEGKQVAAFNLLKRIVDT